MLNYYGAKYIIGFILFFLCFQISATPRYDRAIVYGKNVMVRYPEARSFTIEYSNYGNLPTTITPTNPVTKDYSLVSNNCNNIAPNMRCNMDFIITSEDTSSTIFYVDYTNGYQDSITGSTIIIINTLGAPLLKQSPSENFVFKYDEPHEISFAYNNIGGRAFTNFMVNWPEAIQNDSGLNITLNQAKSNCAIFNTIGVYESCINYYNVTAMKAGFARYDFTYSATFIIQGEGSMDYTSGSRVQLLAIEGNPAKLSFVLESLNVIDIYGNEKDTRIFNLHVKNDTSTPIDFEELVIDNEQLFHIRKVDDVLNNIPACNEFLGANELCNYEITVGPTKYSDENSLLNKGSTFFNINYYNGVSKLLHKQDWQVLPVSK